MQSADSALLTADSKIALFETHLKRLTLEDADLFRETFSENRKKTWCYYFPFIFCYGASPSRDIFWMKISGCLCVFVVNHRPEGVRMNMFFPPLPFSDSALVQCTELMNSFNEDKEGRILWVDRCDKVAMDKMGVCYLRWKEAEYIYDPKKIVQMEGSAYSDLRKRIRRTEKDYKVLCRKMGKEDVDGCMEIMRAWRKAKRHGREGRSLRLLDWAYTRSALEYYAKVPDLSGWVAEIDGKIRGFWMGGRMWEEMANFFVSKGDLDIKGLSEYTRYCFFSEMRKFELVNDASDLGSAGLRQFKRKFRPVETVDVYTADQRT